MSLILFILILGLIVLVHEFGHYLFAKLSGVHVYEFSIGMGKRLFCFNKKNSETEYSIRIFPIGGYVRLAGEDSEDKDTSKDKMLYNKTFLQRFLVLFAGAGFNFVLAIVLLFVTALIFGSVSPSPIVGESIKDYPAYDSGIRSGDKILSVDGKKVSSWDSVLLKVQTAEGKKITFVVEHKNGEKETIKVSPIKVKENKEEVYKYGIAGSQKVEKGFVSSVKYSFTKTLSLFSVMGETVKSLFTGAVSINQMSGPVGIYKVVDSQTTNSIATTIANLLYLTAYLSINVGVINLLPLPAFDGGRILFLIIEKIIKKPVPGKIENLVHNIGFFLLLGLIAYITWHDIVNLFVK